MIIKINGEQFEINLYTKQMLSLIKILNVSPLQNTKHHVKSIYGL